LSIDKQVTGSLIVDLYTHQQETKTKIMSTLNRPGKSSVMLIKEQAN